MNHLHQPMQLAVRFKEGAMKLGFMHLGAFLSWTRSSNVLSLIYWQFYYCFVFPVSWFETSLAYHFDYINISAISSGLVWVNFSLILALSHFYRRDPDIGQHAATVPCTTAYCNHIFHEPFHSRVMG